jgi:hypothetical protein
MGVSQSGPLLLVSRALWLVPAFLLLLALNQLKVGLDLRHTFLDGEPAIAEVTAFDRVDRADVTYGYVSLRIPLKDGTTLTREEMPLPYSLLHRVEGKDSLAVQVLRGASQEVIIQIVGNAQWKMAVIQSSMALIAGLMALAGVWAWSRFLRNTGDPGQRIVEAAHPG